MDIQIQGLSKFTRELKRVDTEFGKELRQAQLKIAHLVEGRAHGAMRSGGRQAAAAVKGVRAKATQKQTIISTYDTPGFTLGVIWGQKRRSGWYADRRYRHSQARQFQPWVGNRWDPGEQAGRPYFVGPAVNESIDEAIEFFGDSVDDLARRAGFR